MQAFRITTKARYFGTPHNDKQLNTQLNIQHNYTQHNNTRHNDTRHNVTQLMPLSRIKKVTMRTECFCYFCAKCRYDECRYPECRGAC